MASALLFAEIPLDGNVSPHSEASEDSGVNSEEDIGLLLYPECGDAFESEVVNERSESSEVSSLYENVAFISYSTSSKQVYNFVGSSNYSTECSIQLLGIANQKDQEFKDSEENKDCSDDFELSDTSSLYENLTFITASSKAVTQTFESRSHVPLLAPPMEFADRDCLNKQFLDTDFKVRPRMDDDCPSQQFENTQRKHEYFADEESKPNCKLQHIESWPRLSPRSTGGILKRSSSYKNRKQGDCREGRQRHYTSSDCLDVTKHDDVSYDQAISDYEVENDEADLSLTLTTQNPARIDVKTLRKKNVNKSKLKSNVYTCVCA